MLITSRYNYISWIEIPSLLGTKSWHRLASAIETKPNIECSKSLVLRLNHNRFWMRKVTNWLPGISLTNEIPCCSEIEGKDSVHYIYYLIWKSIVLQTLRKMSRTDRGREGSKKKISPIFRFKQKDCTFCFPVFISNMERTKACRFKFMKNWGVVLLFLIFL